MDPNSLVDIYQEFLNNPNEMFLEDLKHFKRRIEAQISALESDNELPFTNTPLQPRSNALQQSQTAKTKTDILEETSLETILNHIDAIYLEGDTKGVDKVRGKSEEILGYSIDEWMTFPGGPMKFWEEHLHPDHKNVVEQCLQLTQEGVDHEFVYRMIARDGSIVWIHDKITVTSVDDDFIIQAFMIDITDKKAVEMQMAEQNKFHEIGRIAMGIAHDFNNILAGIVGYSSILEEFVDDPKLLDLVNGINQASDQAKQLSMNLLTYGKSHKKTR